MRKKIKKNPKRINKKVILAVIAAVAIVGGIAAFSAFEAHVINVTAHIENALSVDTTPIDFGTVFPQEYVEEEFIISLSDSFLGQSRVHEVDYIIVQKPKPIWPQTVDCQESHWGIDFEDIGEARAYCHEYPENLDCCYLSLCPFLSKINEEIDEDEGEAENDTDAPSYYVKAVGAPDYCITPGEASGKLTKHYQDTEDRWVVDLKVPPVKGYVGQDWPAGCPTIDEDSKDYGCDLWIEVTGISETGEENGDEKELACTASGGTVTTGMCCLGTGDFPDTCQTGACGCSPENSHEVKVCDCGPGRCFDGTTCVDYVNGCTSGETRPCYTGDHATRNVGLCQDGIQTCVGDVWGACTGDVTPVAEVCDVFDNDCDGVADEGNPGGGGNCNTGLDGICAAGTLHCQGGSLMCVQNNSPQEEVCNGLDDDCDGEVDEGLTQSCSLQLGVCAGATQTCAAGMWSTCYYGPYYEAGTELTCDGLDNDCDGQTDENVCPNNSWTYEQNFNTLSVGDLNGQDSWFGSSHFDVQSSVTYEGDKAIVVSTDNNQTVSRFVSAASDGLMYIAVRRTTISQGYLKIELLENSTGHGIFIIISNTGNIGIYDDGTGIAQTIASYNANQWYVIAVEFNDASQPNKARAKVHNGFSWSSWSSWYTVYGGFYSQIDRINLVQAGVSGLIHYNYWDIITPNDPTP